MKRNKLLYYLTLLLVLVSCASKKQAVVPVVHDEITDKLYQALQHRKDEFFASDSAEMIVRDLGWAERFITGAKISEGSLPSVFRGDEHGFSVELPCWETDSPEYFTANVVVEHSRIDSALILAKMRGADELLMKSGYNISYLTTDSINWQIDKIEFKCCYEEIMRKARFSCVCIAKEKKKYIVNATIQIPNPNYHYLRDDEKEILLFKEELFKEKLRKKFEEYEETLRNR